MTATPEALMAHPGRRKRCPLTLALAVSLVLVACGAGDTSAGAPDTTGPSPTSCSDAMPDSGDPPLSAPTTTWLTEPTTVPTTNQVTTTQPTTTQPTTTQPTTTQPTTTQPTTTRPTTAPTSPAAVPAQAIYRGATSRAVVALTFDAGSDCGYAAQILDTLAADDIKASFGMTGQWARANPDLVRRMVTEGHLLLNHTDDHRSFTGFSTGTAALTAAERRAELDRADATVIELTGQSMQPWFRPPYGDIDDSVNNDLGSAGYRYDVLWTVDSLGWQGLSAAEIEQRCLDKAANGAIYLFHVGSQSADAQALPEIIDGLRSHGYSFARVDDLL